MENKDEYYTKVGVTAKSFLILFLYKYFCIFTKIFIFDKMWEIFFEGILYV